MSGDLNEEVNAKNRRFLKYKITEQLKEVTQNPLEMFTRNTNKRLIDRIWTTPGLEPTNCGYTDYFDSWDHRLVWVDFEEKELFRHKENKIVPPDARRCKLEQVKSVTKNKNKLKELYEISNFEERICTTVKNIVKDPTFKV